MKIEKQKGITIMALVITIVIMLILLGVSTYYGAEALDKAKLEDIKEDMISIKIKAKTVEEQYNFKDIENLVGVPLDENSEQEGIQQSAYNLPNELKTKFEETTNEIPNFDITKLYIWQNEDLQNQGVKEITIDHDNFYIIYYNLENTNSCEIYYSKGYKQKYSLTELQEI